ncbi:purple acid phosphatase family protein [Adhaeribacter radiodurans]|uniref:Metallophosphoesterase family protein n=1 Tax=Adhaeribacter radiodurans TaxID=2745197 RepID=A0A7L7L496_9BACT|nr:metallophosphoesterase family protein [Adhaeribacter radiodurans]QMU27627.1 metallophosphoesterase family protein [Adhaeribacter radiodurans]
MFCKCWSQNLETTLVSPVNATPSPRPDRIILSWVSDPTQSFTVTWRTDNSVKTPRAEVAESNASPYFTSPTQVIPASTESIKTESGAALYHHVNFTKLKPNTLYAYRVGDGTYWSEWYQYKTANNQPEPFSFIYLGDAQNELFSLWSRTIRAAYASAPQAKFMVHTGDLINHAETDAEWQEWFAAGSFIHATIPSLPCPGNHEYTRTLAIPTLTRLWQPQFTLPANGVKGLEDTNYYVDYQNARIISLNSMMHVPAQADWLEKVLQHNPQPWTFVFFHYPVFSTSGRSEINNLAKYWKPIFDKYKVDLVMQGHEHNYARGINLPRRVTYKDKEAGTVYVVSVSGPKMYEVKSKPWMERIAENTQLYQVITVESDRLLYQSITVTGEVYDTFELRKQAGKPNKIVELKADVTTERHFNNTLPKLDK